MIHGRLTIAGLVAFALLGCGGGETDEGSLPDGEVAVLCDGLQAPLPVARRAAIQDIVEYAESHDGDGPSAFDQLDEACPDALTDALAGEFSRNADDAEFRNDVDLDLEQCAARAAEGTIANTGQRTLMVTVRAEFTDDNDVLLRDATDRVAVRGGQTANFSVPFLASQNRYARCRVELEAVIPG